MKNKIQFNWELYQSGEYDVVTRDGRKVEQLHRFDLGNFWGITGVCSYQISWYDTGKYFENNDISGDDLFLIPKEKEERIADVGKTIIPELKGVLMEVSDFEDFSAFVEREVIGRLNGIYITLGGFYQYARPIKEVKEVWLNVFEDNGKLIVGQSHFDSKEEAIKFKSNNVEYIKTIRITNEKDGE